MRAALDACFERARQQFGGVLFTLSIEQRNWSPAPSACAARACCTSGSSAHDSAYDSYSPGVQLARWAVGWAGDNGVAEVDFGPGDYQYKRQLSTTQRMLSRGVVAGDLASARCARRGRKRCARASSGCRNPTLAALPGKAMRRLDLMRALAA